MPFITRALTVGATLALSVAALTACAVDTGPQSTQDACGVLTEGLGNVQEQVTAADTALTTGDVETAQANLASASAGLNSVAPQITNEEIASILTDLTLGLNDVNAAVADITPGDTEATATVLEASSADLRAAVERYNVACGG